MSTLKTNPQWLYYKRKQYMTVYLNQNRPLNYNKTVSLKQSNG